MDKAAKALPPGTIVDVTDGRDETLGTGYFNPHSLIAVRMLSPHGGAKVDVSFFRERFERAKSLRDRLFKAPYYRLIHAEADSCPGLVVDRFDDVFVVQSGTAGMDALKAHWVAALKAEFEPRSIVVKSDAPARSHEGLKDDVGIAHGKETGAIVEEAGVRHAIDPLGGQKTGWFFDQRLNREFLVALSKGATVLDAFCYTGALGLGAVKAGATNVVLLDASQSALDRAAATAKAGKLDGVEFRKADIMEEFDELGPSAERFDIVACDPPPFVRSKKDLESGARGYRKLAKLSAPLVAPGGLLSLSSCSHAIPADRFQQECATGIARAGRTARLIRAAGAAPDHPVHPMLPETAYLKSLVYQLD